MWRLCVLAVSAALLLGACGKSQLEEAEKTIALSLDEQEQRRITELEVGPLSAIEHPNIRKIDPDPSPVGRGSEDWVVAKVTVVSDDFKTLRLKLPADSDVQPGDIFEIYRDYKDLPKSRYVDAHFKQLYLGRAKVLAVGEGSAAATILHRVTEVPIKAGDSAVAKAY